MLDLLWKDAGKIEFNDVLNEVEINNTFKSKLSFVSQESFEQFKTLHDELSPKIEEPFLHMPKFVPRQSTYVMKKNLKTESEVIREQGVEETDYLTFDVLMQKQSFFQGKIWVSHVCELELVKSANLWQVAVQGSESNQNPEVVFLL